jgi:hypothetical protein
MIVDKYVRIYKASMWSLFVSESQEGAPISIYVGPLFSYPQAPFHSAHQHRLFIIHFATTPASINIPAITHILRGIRVMAGML